MSKSGVTIGFALGVGAAATAFADLTFVNPENGHTYVLLSQQLTWQDARIEATVRGGYLASITTATEQSWVYDTIFAPHVQASALQMWLGATDELNEGTWLWDSGEPFVYTNWAPSEPSNRLDVSGPGQPGEDYLSMWNHPFGTWNDYPGPLYYTPGLPEPNPLLGWVLVEIVPAPGAGAMFACGLLAGVRRSRRQS